LYRKNTGDLCPGNTGAFTCTPVGDRAGSKRGQNIFLRGFLQSENFFNKNKK
jgi:hypothetical protein